MIGNVIRSLCSGDIEHVGKVYDIIPAEAYIKINRFPVERYKIWNEMNPDWINQNILYAASNEPFRTCDMKTYKESLETHLGRQLTLHEEENVPKHYRETVPLCYNFSVPEHLVEILNFNID